MQSAHSKSPISNITRRLALRLNRVHRSGALLSKAAEDKERALMTHYAGVLVNLCGKTIDDAFKHQVRHGLTKQDRENLQFFMYAGVSGTDSLLSAIGPDAKKTPAKKAKLTYKMCRLLNNVVMLKPDSISNEEFSDVWFTCHEQLFTQARPLAFLEQERIQQNLKIMLSHERVSPGEAVNIHSHMQALDYLADRTRLTLS